MFIEYAQSRGAINVKIFLDFAINEISLAGQTTTLIWFLLAITFLFLFIAIPVINIYHALFVDDKYISRQKSLLEGIDQELMDQGERL